MMTTETYVVRAITTHTNLPTRRVYKGEGYEASFVADAGYSVYEVKITMGGLDITSSVYDAAHQYINIPHVTADVDIECYAMHSMPSDYVRVDGIKNPNNAYIDTGYKVTPYSRLEVSPVFDSVGIYPFYMICGRGANSTSVNGSGLYLQNAYLWYMYDKSQTRVFNVTSSYYGQTRKISIDYYTKKWAVEGASSGNIKAKVNNDTFNTCLFSGENGYRPQDSAGKIIKFAAIYDHQTNAYVRYYIPCLNASGVAGFWDASQGAFQGSSNSTAFVAKVLQYDAEVEYLESDGTGGRAYINTGIKAANTISFDIKMRLGTKVDTQAFGGRNGYNNKAMYVFFNAVNNRISWSYGSETTNLTEGWSAGDFTLNNTANTNILVVNGNSVTLSSSTFTSDYNMYLFALNNADGAAQPGSTQQIRIYHAKFYSSGALIRDYIPVRLNGFGYLYDKVDGTIVGNSNSSGAFTYGNDVSQ